MRHNTSILDQATAEKNKQIEATFLKEWNSEQFKIMQKYIRVHFYNVWIKTSNKGEYIPATRSFKQIDEILGLAYTSSSNYAGYWVCNVDLLNDKYPGYHYIGFALGTDNKGYAVLWDKDENEIIIELYPL